MASYHDRAVRMALRLLGGDRAAAEDVAQEAFLRAHKALPGFREESKLSTWFYRILIREAGRYRRWRSVRQRYAAEPKDEIPDPKAPGQPDPFLRARIGRALQELSRGQREAFVLVHMEGFTMSEAAAILEVKPGTIKTQNHRAVRALRKKLADTLGPDLGAVGAEQGEGE